MGGSGYPRSLACRVFSGELRLQFLDAGLEVQVPDDVLPGLGVVPPSSPSSHRMKRSSTAL